MANIFIAVIFCGAGFLSLLMIPVGLKRDRAVRAWPQTPGEITESLVVEKQVRGVHRPIKVQAPEVSYRYSVGGKEFIGHTISSSEVDSGSAERAVKRLEPYPVHQRVAVFYDPQNPADALLEKEAGTVVYIWLGLIGSVLLAIGVPFALGIFALH